MNVLAFSSVMPPMSVLAFSPLPTVYLQPWMVNSCDSHASWARVPDAVDIKRARVPAAAHLRDSQVRLINQRLADRGGLVSTVQRTGNLKPM